MPQDIPRITGVSLMEDEDLRIVVNRLKFRYAQLEVEILGIYSSNVKFIPLSRIYY